jgi:hypothetical protein
MKWIYRIINRLLKYTIAKYVKKDSQKRNKLEDTTLGLIPIKELNTKFRNLSEAEKR